MNKIIRSGTIRCKHKALGINVIIICQISWFFAKPRWNLWFPWRRQKWQTRNWHIKISAKDEWTATKSLSPGRVNRLFCILKKKHFFSFSLFSRAQWLIFIVNKRTDTRICNLWDAARTAGKRTIWQFVIVSFSCVCPVIDNELLRHDIV